MWLITTFGFFSVVRKSDDLKSDTLTIRARVREDLEELRKIALPELGPIRDDEGTDYPFRASAPRAAVSAAMARIAQDIDYANCKDAVAARQGKARAHRYGEVWGTLLRLETGGR